MHTLYVIAVPIGNLKEITILGKEKLEELKVIFCEDTRVTKKLLNFLDINDKKEFYWINKFQEASKIDFVIEKLKESDCGLVSDAGYPAISDPGYFLIKALRSLNIPVQVINGPCAFIHAIVMSGVDSRKIYWANFLNKRPIKRKNELEKMRDIYWGATIVFYESCNFLLTGLSLIKEVFGDVKVAVCRELTKMHESFYFDYVDNLKKQITLKGEFVVIIPARNAPAEVEDTDELIDQIHNLILEQKITIREAIKTVKSSSHSSADLYKEYVQKYCNQKS